jgi:hypothetical protein
MNYTKMLLLALMLCIGALSSVNAAVTHNTTLSGYDSEYIYVYASLDDLTPIGEFSSSYWEAEILVYDDQDGHVRYSWWTPSGVVFVEYTVGANAMSWTLTTGSPVSFNAASLAAISYLFPPF